MIMRKFLIDGSGGPGGDGQITPAEGSDVAAGEPQDGDTTTPEGPNAFDSIIERHGLGQKGIDTSDPEKGFEQLSQMYANAEGLSSRTAQENKELRETLLAYDEKLKEVQSAPATAPATPASEGEDPLWSDPSGTIRKITGEVFGKMGPDLKREIVAEIRAGEEQSRIDAFAADHADISSEAVSNEMGAIMQRNNMPWNAKSVELAYKIMKGEAKDPVLERYAKVYQSGQDDADKTADDKRRAKVSTAGGGGKPSKPGSSALRPGMNYAERIAALDARYGTG